MAVGFCLLVQVAVIDGVLINRGWCLVWLVMQPVIGGWQLVVGAVDGRGAAAVVGVESAVGSVGGCGSRLV